MKMKFLKLLSLPFIALFFSCSTSNEGGSSTAETTDYAEDTEVGAAETELVTNEQVTYGNLFNDVDNTLQYNVLELARMDDDLSVFVELVEKAGLESTLMVTEPITVFIPTNEALKQIAAEDLQNNSDPQQKERLEKIIRTHIIPIEVPAKHFTNSKIIETSSGEQIAVDVDSQGSAVKIGGADIIKADVEVSNGIIHVIDAVLETRELSDTAID